MSGPRAACLLLAACGAAREPGPPCQLPPLRCLERCDELVLFTPAAGPGYVDVNYDGETDDDRYASWVRRDLMMLVQYAAAKVACKTGARPIALGDMSQRDGSSPGGDRGHPSRTHRDGRDVDVAYYQQGTPDNFVRPICTVEDRHCVAYPEALDVRRTALFIGALFEHPRMRVVGVDGRAGPAIRAMQERLCDAGWITAPACARIQLVWETKDEGRGWYYSHFNHMHVSFQP